MAKLTIHAGDFMKGSQHSVTFGQFCIYEPGKFMPISIAATDLEEIAPASEENVKKVGGTLGWGAVGGLALGPVGLLAGLLLGGNKKEVTFIAKFKDGRKMLATTDSKSYTKLAAAIF